MQIIAGSCRGMKIQSPKGELTRPTAAKAREAIMQMLSERLDGALFIDFFAGSGAMGLEAISRGCRECYLVDQSSEAGAAIEQNLQEVARRLKAQDIAGQHWVVVRQKAERSLKFLLKHLAEYPADDEVIIFADPPYGAPALAFSKALLEEFLRLKIQRSVLLVIEAASEDAEAVAALFANFANYQPSWLLLKSREYGKATIYFYEFKEKIE